MFKNYLKIAVRNLFRNRLFSFINIFGLALSMSVCLLVLMRLKDQTSYDHFHPHADRTYRILTQLTNKAGNTFRFASTPLPLAPALSADYSFIEATTRFNTAGSRKMVTGKKELELNTAFTEPSFFTLFGFSLKEGDSRTALQDPYSIILSKEAATRFFGNEKVVGQIIAIDNWGSFRVTGVLNAPESKSHIDFDAYPSMSTVAALEKTGKLAPALDQWNNINTGYTYVLAKTSATEKQVSDAASQVAGILMKTSKISGRESIAFDVQPFTKIILGEELINNMGNTGSKSKTLSEIMIALIILLSACFNYTNLSIARSLKRGKEIGIRKVAGAFRLQVFYQFIIESILTSLLSLGLAFVFLKLMMDYAPFASEMVPAGATIDTGLLGWFLLFSLFTGLLAGMLPAWALSAFKPVEVLKNLSNIRLFGGNRFRKALIVAQFTLSLVIIIFTFISFRQFNYVATADPGFRRDSLLNIPIRPADYSILSNEIARLNGVEQVSASSTNLGRNTSGRDLVRLQPESEAIQMAYYDVDTAFVSNMGLSLLAGHSFTGNMGQDAVVNEKAVQALKIATPADAVGRQVWINDTAQVRIAGVVKDFYFRGLEISVTPLLLRNRAANFRFLTIRTGRETGKTLIPAIEKIWKADNTAEPFEYTWVKDELYARQSAWSTVSMLGFLAIIAITIASLGLLGMVMYTTETRRKEIGIRKVMGAGVSAIVYLLSKGFLSIVFIAGAIALPVSYIAGYLFLNLFANRTTISIAMMAGCFGGLLSLVLLTISMRIYRVAVANPVDSLRTE